MRTEWLLINCRLCKWIVFCIQRKEKKRGRGRNPCANAYWMTFVLPMLLRRVTGFSTAYKRQKKRKGEKPRSQCLCVLNGLCSCVAPAQRVTGFPTEYKRREKTAIRVPMHIEWPSPSWCSLAKSNLISYCRKKGGKKRGKTAIPVPIRCEWPSLSWFSCAKSNWISYCIQKEEEKRRGIDPIPVPMRIGIRSPDVRVRRVAGFQLHIKGRKKERVPQEDCDARADTCWVTFVPLLFLCKE